MLYPTAGSKLYIADTPVSRPGSFPMSGWIEIGEVEAIGLLGVSYDVHTVDLPEGNGCGMAGVLVEEAVKFVKRRPEMQIVMGNNPLDPGQQLVWTALHSEGSYPFRLVFPDGTTTRQWFALVLRLGEVFDAANAVMRLLADLKPTSDPQRSEASP